MKNFMNDATMYERVKPADDTETIINIFDFDGTIFNSPTPSRDLWDANMYDKLMSSPKQGGYGWYQNTLTLDDKYISNSTFNEDVLSDIRKSMESPNAITVLLTGRTTAYSNIVQSIVACAGLEFDEFGFKPLGERLTTFNFKTDFIKSLVNKYDACEVNLWDDRINHVIRFREWLDFSGINGKVRHIDLPDGTIDDSELERELVEKLITSSKLLSEG